METVKFIVFVELLGIFITGIIHFVYLIVNKDFPIMMYPIIFGVLLFIVLLTKWIINPFANWFFKL